MSFLEMTKQNKEENNILESTFISHEEQWNIEPL